MIFLTVFVPTFLGGITTELMINGIDATPLIAFAAGYCGICAIADIILR